jgi:hypothetical protein
MAKYQKTVTVYDLMEFDSLTPGQWVRFGGAGGARGQWMGKTRAGVDVVRYQPENRVWGQPVDCTRSAMLRKYAKSHGAK